MNKAIKRTRVTTIQLTVSNQAGIKFGGALPSDIDHIYGMCTHVVGAGPANETLITLANAHNLYLVLRDGTDSVIDHLKLSDLLFVGSLTATEASAALSERKYLPVSIAGCDLDLRKCEVANPSGVSSGEVVIWLWYTKEGE